MKIYQLTILIFLLLKLNISYASRLKREINDETEHKLKLNLNNDTLIFAHVIYRHGDRNIDKIYPNDPYKDEIHWPGGIGELTRKGKQRHFVLGKYFRRRYSKLIGDAYSPNKIYIQSSDVDRTIMSALSNLAGWFIPNEDEERWNKDILWTPIPIHTIPKQIDRTLFIRFENDCPKYKAEFQRYLANSDEVQQIYKEYTHLFQFWSQKCGLNITTTDDVYRLYNTLIVEQKHNKTLLEWAEKAIEPNGIMEYIAMFDIKTYADTPLLARLSSGFLLKEMLVRFSHKANATLQPNRSIWVYSTHYYVITNILNALGLFKPHLPSYAASLLIELYKTDEDEHYIQLFYKDSDNENLLPLNLPKCGEKCSLSKFHELYNDIIAGDFDDECRLQ